MKQILKAPSPHPSLLLGLNFIPDYSSPPQQPCREMGNEDYNEFIPFFCGCFFLLFQCGVPPTKISNVNPPHGLLFFQITPVRVSMGSQVLLVNPAPVWALLSTDLQVPLCQEPAPAQTPTGSQPPLRHPPAAVWVCSRACRGSPHFFIWTSMGCMSTAASAMVFTTGCRGISTLAPQAPPALSLSIDLVSAELFLSHILSPLFFDHNYFCEIIIFFS